MDNSKLWEDGEEKVLHKLRFLRITDSKLRTFDLRLAPNLERLNIEDCDDFEELHIPADHHSKLEYLTLTNSKLTNLHLGNTPNLVGLDIHSSNIVQLWEDGEEKVLHKLRFLTIRRSKLQTFDLRLAPNLEWLHIEDCDDFEELHIPADHHSTLEYLHLTASKQTNLHLGNTPNLVQLDIHSSNIVQLWEDGEEKVLHKLRFLTIRRTKLQTFDLRLAPNLERLHIEDCDDFEELHIPADHHSTLEYLHLTASKQTNLHLGNTPNLVQLDIHSSNIVQLWEDGEEKVLHKLRFLNISVSKLRTFDLRLAPNLEWLTISNCHDFEELHIPADHHSKLEYLTLTDSKLTNLHLGNTPNLVGLDIHSSNIVQLWEDGEEKVLHKLRFLRIFDSKLRTFDLKVAPNLEQLHIEDCDDFEELHIPADHHSALEYLHLTASKQTNLHLGNTPNLVGLDIHSSNIVQLWEDGEEKVLHKLRFLRIFDSKLRTFDLKVAPNLEQLHIEDCDDFEELHIPADHHSTLEYLHLTASKQTNLHLGNTPNLVQLDIHSSNIVQLWEDGEEKVLHKLRLLTIRRSKLQTFDLRLAPNLERLHIEDCDDFEELHIPADHHSTLEYLHLTASKQTNLHLGNTPNLEMLILKGCNDLVELQMPVESLKLKYLDLSHSKLKTIDLRNSPNLEKLILKGCNDLAELQMPAESLELALLDLSYSKLTNLHLRNTPNLKTLILERCTELVELQMPAESVKLLSLNLSHSKLRTLDLGLTPTLERLDLVDCYNSIKIDAPFGYLKKLVISSLCDCGRFTSFVFDKERDLCEVSSLFELQQIAEPRDAWKLHRDNNFGNLKFSCYYKEDPASSFRDLERLISVGLCACSNIESIFGSICSLQGLRKLTLEGSIPEVPRDLDLLECLEELIFSSTKIRTLPDSICMLMHLKAIKLKSCWHLEKLPEDLGRLRCLEELDLTECIVLRDIPNSICQMKSLKYFHLPYCFLVEKLPEEIGSLIQLEELNIEGTGISHLPQSIFQLKRLRINGFTWQLQSYGFRTVFPTSTYVSFAYTSYHSSANHPEKTV